MSSGHRRPRIVYYLDPAGYGGAVKYIERLMKQLDPGQFEIALICPDEPALRPLFDVARQVGAVIVSYDRPSDVRVNSAQSLKTPLGRRVRNLFTHLPPLRGLGKAALAVVGVTQDRNLARKTQQVIASCPGDVLHVNLDRFPDSTGRLALVAAQELGMPAMASLHAQPTLPVFPSPINNYYDRRAMAAVKRVVLQPESFIPYLTKLYGVPPHVIRRIPNGVPDACFEVRPSRLTRAEVGASDDEFLIVQVANIQSNKGQQFLIEAAKREGEGQKVRCLFVGDARDQQYAAACRKATEQGRFTWLGYRDDSTEVMRLADLVAVPSLHEAHSLALLEAMALGKPIVATDVGANAESVEAEVSGLVVPASDAGALQQAISRIRTSPALAQSLGQAARKRARDDFSEAKMASRTIECYRELLSARQ